MDITGDWDYIAHEPYNEIKRVCRASKQQLPPMGFWSHAQRELASVETRLVVSHRINPFSPSTYMNSFYSDLPISPSNQVNVITEKDPITARAACILLNSIFFYANFFLLKEESTGRYINIRFYDLEEMSIFPKAQYLAKLNKVYKKYKSVSFSSLREQFDENFDQRYKEYWDRDAGETQQGLWPILKEPIKPHKQRLKLDLDVCEALELSIAQADLLKVYETIVNEMILIRRLTKD
jgi:hypothetical protein